MDRRVTVIADEATNANSLLAALPRAVSRRLHAAGLEPVTLIFGQILHEPGEPIRYVYFPIDCIVTLLMMVNDRHSVKVAQVGHQGMVGSALALGIHASPRRALVTGTGLAMRMKSSVFRKEIAQSKPLRQIIYRYKHALMGEISQSAACEQFHSVQANLARYLLTTSDCAGSGNIELTHEFLARMLGVQRAAVTVAAGGLQKRRLIKYSHGKITILDRKRLGAIACECYQTIKRIYAEIA